MKRSRWKSKGRRRLVSVSGKHEMKQAWAMVDGEIQYGRWYVYRVEPDGIVLLGIVDDPREADVIVDADLWRRPLREAAP